MNTTDSTKHDIIRSLQDLLKNPTSRPFIFRTRFERIMLRLISFAEKTGNDNLKNQAAAGQQKMQDIIDKSNTSADGMLRSYEALSEDIKSILVKLEA